jgi:hypothetical protein
VSTQLVEVFLGDPIDDPNEQRVLNRLRADLHRRGIPARMYANFIAGRQQRQVDLFICTDHRLVHAELKVLDASRPLVAAANGPWVQRLPDGTERALERNFYRQAHEATYALSDDMRYLARRGEAPPALREFFRCIQTVLCLYPDVPAGSTLMPYNHVDVVDYDQLLQLLGTDGPRPPWTDEHWAAFARQLRLYPQPTEPVDAALRAQQTALEDYRLRYAAAHRAGLHEYVPVPARAGTSELPDPGGLLTEAVRAQRLVVLTGPSGVGKSHAVRHAALAVAADGGVPVWVRCAEYQQGRFSVALARAVAPFTAVPWQPLLRRALDDGHPVVVVLDGLNECAPDARTELLEQLGALRLRMPVAAIVTSTVDLPQPVLTDIVEVSAAMPDDDARAALLASYGADGMRGAEPFRTPLELSLAAECRAQLPPGAGAAELFDAYIGHRCQAETTRAGLRRLATEMDGQLRGSLTVPEVRAVLHRGAGVTEPDAAVDSVLQSPLLHSAQGRVAFTHEQLARFLAAEQLVLAAPDPAALTVALEEPHHRDLRPFAVALEHDRDRRRELLVALADVELLFAAVRGDFGPLAAVDITAAVTDALTAAAAATQSAELLRDDDYVGSDDEYEVRWRTAAPRSPRQQALLHVAAVGLAEGRFIPETAVLFDVTDHVCATAIGRLREGGHRWPIHAVTRATCAFFTYGPEREAEKLPASVILTTCQHDALHRWHHPEATARATAMWDATVTPPRWTRVTAALLLVHTRSREDLALLPELLSAAWAAGGYHLRLEALTVVTEKASVVDEATTSRLRELLEDCNPNNIMLNGTWFDAMAAYDVIEPANSAADIQVQIDAVLADPDNPDACAAARGLVGMLFENQAVLGPYAEVILGLDDARALQLYVMAARADATPFNSDWIMTQIVARLDHAGDAAREVVRAAATTLEWDGLMAHEAVIAHLAALHGWAQLADRLPPPDATAGDLARRAWRLVDELIFDLLRGAPARAAESGQRWAELLYLCAPAAVDVLSHLRSASSWHSLDGPPAYARLRDAYPDEVRRLLVWGVGHRDRIVATLPAGPLEHRVRALLADLAELGTAETASALQVHALDPEIGPAVVVTIRAIEARMR